MSSNVYPACCLSGTGNYYAKYQNNISFWCASDNDYKEDPSTTFFPCGAGFGAKVWEKEREACCINAKPLECVEAGLCSRLFSVAQCIADTATCTLCCVPVCVGTTVVSCGSGACACVHCCVAECYTAERKDKLKQDVDTFAQWAFDCYGNGMLFSAGLCGSGVKALVCCPINVTCPEFANMWCWQQKCNWLLFQATRWDDTFKELISKEAPEAAAPPAAAVETPGA